MNLKDFEVFLAVLRLIAALKSFFFFLKTLENFLVKLLFYVGSTLDTDEVKLLTGGTNEVASCAGVLSIFYCAKQVE